MGVSAPAAMRLFTAAPGSAASGPSGVVASLAKKREKAGGGMAAGEGLVLSVALGIHAVAVPVDGLDQVHAAVGVRGFAVIPAAFLIAQGLARAAQGQQIRRTQVHTGGIVE
jgi:hypothetical protein